VKTSISMNTMQVIALVIGFVVSFLVALLVVDKFINFLKRKPMRVFAIYRILIGAIILILAFTKLMPM